MRDSSVRAGVHVRTLTLDREPLAEPAFIKNRFPARSGVVVKPMVTDKSFWWIRHADGRYAPYHYSELEEDDWFGSPL